MGKQKRRKPSSERRRVSATTEGQPATGKRLAKISPGSSPEPGSHAVPLGRVNNGDPAGEAGGRLHDDEEAEALKSWAKTRHGAIAGRGFHYQDAVGAWVGAQMLSGTFDFERLVPEGREDLSGEAANPFEFQVKSRQARRGGFSVGEIVGFVLSMEERNKDRAVGTRLVLVLERGIEDVDLPRGVAPLSSLSPEHPLRTAVDTGASQRHLNDTRLLELVENLTVYVLTWHEARVEARDVISTRYDVPPAIAERAVLDIRARVGECSDQNVTPSRGERAFLDRTTLEAIVAGTISETDRSLLLEAISSGACEPVDLDSPAYDARYYEGLDAQPGHIAAGLPAPRPDVTGAVVDAIFDRGTVLIAGPSGVGKSTVMWTAAYVTRNITWFRVHRLTREDVEPIFRLVKAYRPTGHSPIGFIVDAVGTGAMQAWDDLHRRVQQIEHVYLLGSVRVEDILDLTTIYDAARVEVALDEHVAAKLFAGLREAGVTKQHHWREAYETAEGLTLEFTYFLTQGRRLSDVLEAQVRRKVTSRRDLEVAVLALVACAHTCGISVSLGRVQAHLGASDGAIRNVLAVLADEHLVREDSGRLRGLHQLRSAALNTAVHRYPPPVLADTITSLLEIVDLEDIPRLITGIVTDHPELDEPLVDRLAPLTSRDDSPAWLLAAALLALRAADFRREAGSWRAVMDQAEVPPALWSVTVQMALLPGGNDVLLETMKPAVAQATEILRRRISGDSPLRDKLLDRLGEERVAGSLVEQDSVSGAATLIAGLDGRHVRLGQRVSDLLDTDAPLVTALRIAPVSAVGELLYLAVEHSTDLAKALADAAGGEEQLINRVCSMFPNMYQAERQRVDQTDVAYARLLHVHDALTGDPSENARMAARVLLRCLIGCGQADVETVLPGGASFRVGEFNAGVSKMHRLYARTSLDVDWNRSRALIALHELGRSVTTTERVERVVALLGEAQAYLSSLARGWVTARADEAQLASLTQQRSSLWADADCLTTPIDALRLLQETLPGTAQRMAALI
jgi:hypothetical protein